MTRVIGIDPSTSATGLALPGGSFRTLSPHAGAEDVAGRLHEHYAMLSGILGQLRAANAVDVAVVEDLMPTGGMRPKVLRQLAFLGGVVRLALYEKAIPFVEVHPLSLKKYATGNGAAQKQDMTKAARNAGALVGNDNEADAHFLQKVALDFYDSPPGWPNLEPHQIELLGRLTFPKVQP